MDYNQIQDDHINQLVRRRLNLQPGVGTIAPELFPVMVVQDDTPDLQYLKGVKMCGGGGEVGAGGAGTGALWSLFNPVGSGIIATLTGFCASTLGDVAFLSFGFGTTVGSNLLARPALDTRWQKNQSVTGRARCELRSGNHALQGLNDLIAEFFQGAATNPNRWTTPLVLAPGTAVRYQNETNTVPIDAFWVTWTERPAQPSELG